MGLFWKVSQYRRRLRKLNSTQPRWSKIHITTTYNTQHPQLQSSRRLGYSIVLDRFRRTTFYTARVTRGYTSRIAQVYTQTPRWAGSWNRGPNLCTERGWRSVVWRWLILHSLSITFIIMWLNKFLLYQTEQLIDFCVAVKIFGLGLQQILFITKYINKKVFPISCPQLDDLNILYKYFIAHKCVGTLFVLTFENLEYLIIQWFKKYNMYF